MTDLHRVCGRFRKTAVWKRTRTKEQQYVRINNICYYNCFHLGHNDGIRTNTTMSPSGMLKFS